MNAPLRSEMNSQSAEYAEALRASSAAARAAVSASSSVVCTRVNVSRTRCSACCCERSCALRHYATDVADVILGQRAGANRVREDTRDFGAAAAVCSSGGASLRPSGESPSAKAPPAGACEAARNSESMKHPIDPWSPPAWAPSAPTAAALADAGGRCGRRRAASDLRPDLNSAAHDRRNRRRQQRSRADRRESPCQEAVRGIAEVHLVRVRGDPPRPQPAVRKAAHRSWSAATHTELSIHRTSWRLTPSVAQGDTEQASVSRTQDQSTTAAPNARPDRCTTRCVARR